jgi:hypothetical protein
MAKNNLRGISIAVVENGEYEWSKGFGMADLENLVPATSQTLYRLASISKPITATAAMVLWERGKLDSLEATHRSQNCKQTSPKCLFDEYFHETALWGPSGKAKRISIFISLQLDTLKSQIASTISSMRARGL